MSLFGYLGLGINEICTRSVCTQLLQKGMDV